MSTEGIINEIDLDAELFCRDCHHAVGYHDPEASCIAPVGLLLEYDCGCVKHREHSAVWQTRAQAVAEIEGHVDAEIERLDRAAEEKPREQ